MKKQIIFDFYKTLYNPKSGSLFRGVKTLLKTLSNSYFLILITTGGNQRKLLIQNLRLYNSFDQILITNKKTALIFNSVSSKNTIIIGDRIDEEIKIAKILNLQAITVDPLLENPVKTIKRRLK